MRTKSSEKETPFTHLKDAFRWGSTLGFLPGKGPENEIGQFVFSNWHCVKCMFSGSTIFISWLFIYGAMFINGVTLTDISNFLKNEVGFSTTDVISANIFELLWIINTYLPIYVFKKSTAGLNRFIKDVGNISECSPVSSNANKRIAMKNMRIVNMFHGLHFVQNFLTTCYMVSFLMNVSKLREDLATDTAFLITTYLGCILFFLLNHMMTFPMFVGFVDLITYQSCGFLAEAFNEWAQTLAMELENIGFKTNKPKEQSCRAPNLVYPESMTCLSHLEIEKHLDFGYRLTFLTESCDDALKYINVGNFVALVVFIILSMFTSSSLAFNIFNPNVCKESFSLAFLILSCLLVLRLYFLCSCGQFLIDARLRAARNLEDYLSNDEKLDADDFFETISIKSRFLLERLRMDNPLKPLGLFVINNANFFTAESTIITYAAVLLQFKVTDVFGNGGPENSLECWGNATNSTYL